MEVKYNIAIIDALDSVSILTALDHYGKFGWKFVGWANPYKPLSEESPWLKEAIFIVP